MGTYCGGSQEKLRPENLIFWRKIDFFDFSCHFVKKFGPAVFQKQAKMPFSGGFGRPVVPGRLALADPEGGGFRLPMGCEQNGRGVVGAEALVLFWCPAKKIPIWAGPAVAP